VAIPAAFLVPWSSDRVGTRRSQLLTVGLVTLGGFIGIVLAPDAAFLWAAVIGLGIGAVFPLVLTLPVDVSGGASAVGATAAFMLLFGYGISSFGPVLLGVLRDATGNYETSLWLLVVLSVSLLLASLALTPARVRRGVSPLEREPVPAS